jgi:crotonobetainyl-CoA:carnitine CoA-transferase CaiB-like acyl-CoA transferase
MLGSHGAADIKVEPSGRGDCVREVLRRLVADTDVFIDGGVPGAIDRLGFGYEQLAALNHDLVYCRHSASGADGHTRRSPFPGSE